MPRNLAPLLGLLLCTGVCFAQEKAPTPDELIDEVVKHPTGYFQMCTPPSAPASDIPIPLYGKVVVRFLFVIESDVDKLRNQRDGVVAALGRRIDTMDPTMPAKTTSEKYDDKGKMQNSGIDPAQWSGILGDIIIGLKASEDLPQLLRYENRVHDLIKRAQSEPKLEIFPAQDLEFFFFEETKPIAKPKALVTLLITQRELLSLMLELMRDKKFQPMLDSDIEKIYATAIKARAEKEDLRDIKTPADAVKHDKKWLSFDPIYNIPIGPLEKRPELPYTEQSREEIRGLVEKFLKSPPQTAPQ